MQLLWKWEKYILPIIVGTLDQVSQSWWCNNLHSNELIRRQLEPTINHSLISKYIPSNQVRASGRRMIRNSRAHKFMHKVGLLPTIPWRTHGTKPIIRAQENVNYHSPIDKCAISNNLCTFINSTEESKARQPPATGCARQRRKSLSDLATTTNYFIWRNIFDRLNKQFYTRSRVLNYCGVNWWSTPDSNKWPDRRGGGVLSRWCDSTKMGCI